MIRAVMVMNTLGKPRLSKFYDFQPVEKQHQLIRHVYAVLSSRPDKVSNFVQVESIFGPGTKLVYKHFATLYFVMVFDSSENELAMLDLIQGQVLETNSMEVMKTAEDISRLETSSSGATLVSRSFAVWQGR